MIVELRKSTFGYDQNATLEIENKMNGVHITVIKAEYPALINHGVIEHIVNSHRGPYGDYCHSFSDCKKAANTGFLAKKVADLEAALEDARFAQKIAKRNKLFVHMKDEES